jgi:hypothetical protein
MPKSKIIKEFRLIMYVNASESVDFWGGRAAASPLAYYYHAKNDGKVFLGGKIKRIGFGKYKHYISEFFEENDNFTLPAKIDCHDEEVIISNIGYFYQNKDPLFRRLGMGIYWQYAIDRIGKSKTFTKQEHSEYTLSSVDIGDENEEDRSNSEAWKALVSDLVLLQNPINGDGDDWNSFKLYDGKNSKVNFYKNDGTKKASRNNVFVHLGKDIRWKEFDSSQDYEVESELRPIKIIDSNIKNTRIKESLVHEAIKVLAAEKGWFINSEKGTGDSGRIDFLIKKSESDPFTVVEVKLLDKPDAVNQLEGYMQAITSDVKRNKNNSRFYCLWDDEKNKMKPLEGVILCAAPGKETIKECKRTNFKVWTYKFNKIPESKECLLGITITDEKGHEILKA